MQMVVRSALHLAVERGGVGATHAMPPVVQQLLIESNYQLPPPLETNPP